jgi:hypothetical protein
MRRVRVTWESLFRKQNKRRAPGTMKEGRTAENTERQATEKIRKVCTSIYIFKWLKKIKSRILHVMWKLYQIKFLVHINTVVLEHTHAHSLIYG